MKITTKDVALTGIGISMFVALSLCLQVPVFENYYLCLGYIVMAVYLYVFGITKGAIVGVIGTILYCFLINGLRGMPGWATGNIVIAIVTGLCFLVGKKIGGKKMEYPTYWFGIVIGCFLGIMLTKSFIEVCLYSQPLTVRMTSNVYAFVADLVVLTISLPICKIMQKYANKYNIKK